MLLQSDYMLFNCRMPVNFVEFIIKCVRLLCQFEINTQTLRLFYVVFTNAIVSNYFQYLPIVRLAMFKRWQLMLIATLHVGILGDLRGLIWFWSHHLNPVVPVRSLKLQIRVICHPLNLIRFKEMISLDFIENGDVIVVGIGHVWEVLVQL